MPRTVGLYEIGCTIGRGAFGKVKYARHTLTGEERAIKVMEKSKISAHNLGYQIKQEITAMKRINHPNVLNLVEVLASKTKIFIVLELVTGGELFDLIAAKGKCNEKIARKYFTQLINGVQHCHSKGVVHRDLKPENLLLDANNNLKISDFGLSALSLSNTSGIITDNKGNNNNNKNFGDMEESIYHTTCGTPHYLAPEVLVKVNENDGYDGKKADIWSCGVILYVLLTGSLPFDNVNMTQLFRSIVKADYNIPSHCSDGVVFLLSRILVSDPNERATIEEIIQDPWFLNSQEEEEEEVISKFSSSASIPIQGTTMTTTTSSATGMIPLPCNGAIAINSSLLPTELASYLDPTNSSFDNNKNSPEMMSSNSTSAVAQVSDIELDSEEEEEEKRAQGPISMNAFDLIHMVSGQALHNMFQGSSSISSETRIKNYTQFFSHQQPQQILIRITQSLDTMDCQYRVLSNSAKLKVQFFVPNKSTLVKFTIQLYRIAKDNHLVECRRTEGNLFAYHNFYKQLHSLLFDIEQIEEASPSLGPSPSPSPCSFTLRDLPISIFNAPSKSDLPPPHP